MTGQTIAFLEALLEQPGVAHLSPDNLVMIVIGSAMIYLAIVKHYEPLLLIGIGLLASSPRSGCSSRNFRCAHHRHFGRNHSRPSGR